MDGGVEEPLAGVFLLFPLSETDGCVFVTVSGGPGAAHDGGDIEVVEDPKILLRRHRRRLELPHRWVSRAALPRTLR